MRRDLLLLIGVCFALISLNAQTTPLTLSVSTNSVGLNPANDNSKSVIVTSNTSWTAVASATWLTVTPLTTTTGDAILTISAASSGARSATVTVSAPGVTSQVISVTQTNPYLDPVNSASLNPDNNNTETLAVLSNTTWTAVSNDAWITVFPSVPTTGNATVQLFGSNNLAAGDSRTGTVSITAPGAITEVIFVNQSNPRRLNILTKTKTLTSLNSNKADIYVDTNMECTALSSESWLTASLLGNPEIFGYTTLYLSAPPLTTANSRSATVTVSGTGVTSQIITVLQTKTCDLTVTSNTVALTPTNSNTFEVGVTSNTTWTPVSSQSWLTISPSVSTTGNANLTLSAQAITPGATTRSATVTLSAADAKSQVITVTQSNPIILSVSSSSVTLNPANSNTTTLDVTSNITWTAKSSQSWLTVSPAATLGNSTLTLVAEALAPGASRTATITLSAPGLSNRVINVTQIPPSLAVGVANIYMNPNSNTSTVAVTSNTSWTAVSSQTWLTASLSSLTAGNANITMVAEPITDGVNRSATVTVSAVGVPDKVITIYQNAPYTTVSANLIDFSYGLSVSSNTNWVATSPDSWLTYTPTEGISGNTSILFSALPIPPGTSRSSIVTISAPGVITKYVTVRQSVAAVLYPSVNTVSLTPNNSNSTTVAVTSNMTWTAVSSQPWLTVTPTDATTGNGTLSLSASVIPPGPSRTATVTLSSPGATSRVITVTQTNPIVLTVASNSVSLTSFNLNTTTVAVISNVAWMSVSSDPWLIVTPSEPTMGNGTLNVSASDITSELSRIGTITLYAPGVSSQIINVLQKADATQLKIQIPFMESFEMSSIGEHGWYSQMVGSYWSGQKPEWSIRTYGEYPTCSPSNGSKMCYFNSYYAAASSYSRLRFPTLSFLNFNNVNLSFDMYHDSGDSSNDLIKVQTSSDGINWSDVAGGSISRYRSTNGWVQHVISLPSFTNPTSVYLGILGVSGYGNNIFIDNIKVDGISIPTTIDEIKDNNISFYPNPSSGIINFSGCNGSEKITISDLSGTVVWSGFASSFPLNIDHFMSGVYFINIEKDGKLESLKMMKR